VRCGAGIHEPVATAAVGSLRRRALERMKKCSRRLRHVGDEGVVVVGAERWCRGRRHGLGWRGARARVENAESRATYCPARA
jgi:hypothetical protein